MFAVVVGGGKVGRALTRTLLSQGHEVVVIDKDPVVYSHLLEEFPESAFFGDATEARTLRQAGVERADALAAVTGQDQANLVAAELALKKFKVSHVVARVNDPRNAGIFRAAGIAHAVDVTAMIMATVTQELEMDEILRLVDLRRGNLELVEVNLPEGATAAGRAIREVELPPGSAVVAVCTPEAVIPAPPDHVLAPGEGVLAVVPPGREEDLRKALLG